MIFKVFVAVSKKHNCFRDVMPRHKVFGYRLSQQRSDVIFKGLIFVELQTFVEETITLSRNVMSHKSWYPKKTQFNFKGLSLIKSNIIQYLLLALLYYFHFNSRMLAQVGPLCQPRMIEKCLPLVVW